MARLFPWHDYCRGEVLTRAWAVPLPAEPRWCVVQWWVWLVIVVIIIVVVIGGVLAIQARRRTGGVIINDRNENDAAR